MKQIVILYHKNCPDGFGAAWAAWKKFKERAEYIGVEHHTPLPKGLKNKKIFLVDFSYTASLMEDLTKKNKEVIIIDHHITGKSVAESIPGSVFELGHSGSVLTWKYFHPKEKVPWLLKYIEDIDIWKFKVPRSKEMALSLDLYDYNFKVWSRIAFELENSEKRKKYITEGAVIMKYRKKLIGRILTKAEDATLFGKKVRVVNSPVWASDLGHLLLEGKKAVGVVWSYKKGTIRVSLRSNGKIDVAKMAEKFGGGGHKAASGFALPFKVKFPWK